MMWVDKSAHGREGVVSRQVVEIRHRHPRLYAIAASSSLGPCRGKGPPRATAFQPPVQRLPTRERRQFETARDSTRRVALGAIGVEQLARDSRILRAGSGAWADFLLSYSPQGALLVLAGAFFRPALRIGDGVDDGPGGVASPPSDQRDEPAADPGGEADQGGRSVSMAPM